MNRAIKLLVLFILTFAINGVCSGCEGFPNTTSEKNETGAPDSVAPTGVVNVTDDTEKRIIQDFLEAIYAQKCLGFDYWETESDAVTKVTLYRYYDYDRGVLVVRKRKTSGRGSNHKTTITYGCSLLSDSFVPKYYATEEEIEGFEKDVFYREFIELSSDQKKYERLVPEECRYKEGPGMLSLANITPAPVVTQAPTRTPPKTSDSFVLKYYNANIGDVIEFGKYKDETIQWKVLAREGDRLLIISRYGLAGQKYNNAYEGATTWETCDLRVWLNGDFLKEGFTKEEQKRVLTTELSPDNNPNYSTSPGKKTKDKVFILSASEVIQYFPENERERSCAATTNAQYNEDVTADLFDGGRNHCSWWLRTPGENQYSAAVVWAGGTIMYDGWPSYMHGMAVRPVMWISIKP